jgi:hypothetical protein
MKNQNSATYKKKTSPIIVVERKLIKSTAFLQLRGVATQVYLIFRTKLQVSNRKDRRGKRSLPVFENNGEIVFTYQEANNKYGISKTRFRNALDQLIEKGFIDVAQTGMGVHKVTTFYAISDRWRHYGMDSFQQAKRPKAPIANPGFKKGNEFWRLREVNQRKK